MNAHHLPDALVTRFVDDTCTPDEHAAVAAHLESCGVCREQVQAESTARRLVQARVAAAQRAGALPGFRPRVWRLGRPLLPIRSASLAAGALAVAALIWLWPSSQAATTIGVIGDSYCGHAHRFTVRYGVTQQRCTLGCVERGADFVLVTDGAIYRIANQEFPALASFADQRVRVTGPRRGNDITIAHLQAVP